MNEILFAAFMTASLIIMPFKTTPPPASSVRIAAEPKTAWELLFDGSNLDSWNTLGDANWKLVGDAVSADSGSGMLVSKERFRDFMLEAEFWADAGTNSGIFFRCSDEKTVNDANCYEANIFDSRPDQSGRTGAITGITPPLAVVDSEGRWNKYEIFVEGSRILVVLNGVVTVDFQDERHKDGWIGLQFAKGGIRFRNVRLRRLS